MNRTPQDYAIEHAEYMAKTAEAFLDAANGCEQLLLEGAPLEMRESARETYSDLFSRLRSDIYEFRKRAERAKASRPEVVPTEIVAAWIEHHKGGDNLVWEKTNGECTPLFRRHHMNNSSSVKLPGQDEVLDKLRAIKCERKEG